MSQGVKLSDVEAMLVTELKETLFKFQLETTGLKAELKSRLLSYLEEQSLLIKDIESAAANDEELTCSPQRTSSPIPTPQDLPPMAVGMDPTFVAMLNIMQQNTTAFMAQMAETQQRAQREMDEQRRAMMDLMHTSLNASTNQQQESKTESEVTIKKKIETLHAHHVQARIEKIQDGIKQNISTSILKTQVTALRAGLGKLEDYMFEHNLPEYESWFDGVCGFVLDLECETMNFIEVQEKKNKHEEELKKAGALPQNIEIPKLYHADEYPIYWETFENLIHKNEKISIYWKFQYLRQGMKGEAKHVLDAIPPLLENYADAVKTIQDRFGQPRKVVRQSVKCIVGLPAATSDGKSLRKTYDSLLTKYRTVSKYQEKLENPLDTVLMPILESKLPTDLKEEWERKLLDESCEFSSADSFFHWLSNEVQAKEVIADSLKKDEKKLRESRFEDKFSTTRFIEKPFSAQGLVTTEERRRVFKTFKKCLYCRNNGHVLETCFKFERLQRDERFEFTKENAICFLCLVPLSNEEHRLSQCYKRCSICSKPHHRLLHVHPKAKKDVDSSDSESEANGENEGKNEVKTKSTSASVTTQSSEVDTILPTAKAYLSNGKESKVVTIAFDTMCQRTFVSSWIPMKFNKSADIAIDVVGFGNVQTEIKTWVTKLTLSPLSDINCKIQIQATVKEGRICAPVKPLTIDFDTCTHLKRLKLADQFPRKCEEEVDVLIGLDHLFQFFGGDFIAHPDNSKLPVAIESMFGYVVLGPNSLPKTKRKGKGRCAALVSTVAERRMFGENTNSEKSLDEQLEQFWKIESIGIISETKVLTKDERLAEDQFEKSIQYDGERYQCGQTMKPNAPTLVSNYDRAEKQMIAIEKRMMNDPDSTKKVDYDTSIMDYERLGFAREATSTEVQEFASGSEVVVPHHLVTSSAKDRAVFNASAEDRNGNSLNDCVLPGPALQPDIAKVMIRFRRHVIALMGDIAKMFCQTKIDPSCYKFQQFLWRSYNLQSKPKRYIMTRLMFGIASSPFLAMATVRHHLTRQDMQELYENACKAALENTYVDDVCTGGNTDAEVIALARDLIDVFQKGGWKLTKFVSNSKRVMESIPEEDRLPSLVVNLEENEYGFTKALGIGWDVENDVFCFRPTENLLKVNKIETKRTIVSKVSQIFDVFGFVAAFTIRAKIFIQKLWLLKVGWDEPLNEETISEYKFWCDELYKLSEIKIPRCIIPTKPKRIEIHTFADASEAAYGAVVYLRIEDENGAIYTRFIIAKTRVAPLKQKTLARLELLASLAAAKLVDYVKDALKNEIQIDDVYIWSDAEIVLAWISKPSNTWKTFVANRVQEIHDSVDFKSFHKVRSEDNPADILTRGITLDELKTNHKYWHGPEWLSLPKTEWPNMDCSTTDNIEIPEVKIKVTSLPTEIEDEEPEPRDLLVLRCEKYAKIRRIVATMRRWKLWVERKKNGNLIQNADLAPITTDLPQQLTAQEINVAEIGLWRSIQWEYFPDEFQALSTGKKISSESKILHLDPKYDERRDILIVGGRLQFANLPVEAKHQVILPSDDTLVSKLIQHFHEVNCHAPMETTFTMTRQKYWIVHGRRTVNTVVRNCLVCRHSRTVPLEQKMGPLPAQRTNLSPTFTDIGLDFTGAVSLKVGKSTVKAYICIFTCANTRLVHLELCNDMTTEEFLLAFRRAINRRGKCKSITSDNQSTFHRADKLLRLSFSQRLMNMLGKDKIARILADLSIEWNFIAPKSPFRGGFYERLVRSVKEPLRKILGKALLSYTEFYTLLTDIEAMLNQRPLTHVSSQHEDPNPITPAHLAIGRDLGEVPDIPYSKNEPISQRYRYLQRLRNQLWIRFSTEYLHTLQSFPKWKIEKPEIKIGDVCLIADKNKLTNRNSWPLARVVSVIPSKDGIIRTAKLKTAKGVLTRPVQNIHILESAVVETQVGGDNGANGDNLVDSENEHEQVNNGQGSENASITKPDRVVEISKSKRIVKIPKPEYKPVLETKRGRKITKPNRFRPDE